MAEVRRRLKSSAKDRPTRCQLEELSKEDLINYVLRLEANNFQLKNVLKKYLSKNPDDQVFLKNLSLTFGQEDQENKNAPTISDDRTKCKAPTKKQRPFDFQKFAKRHVLIRFLYFGWDYQGFVVQDDTNATIEHYIFEALTKTCLIESRQTSNYFRCGRTDKDVSAFYQVISIDIRSKFLIGTEQKEFDKIEEELDYCGILNRVLPKNIQCVAWMPVRCPMYNARFDCFSRTYRYYFPRGNLNIEAMRIACKYLECEGDFRNLCKMDVQNGVTNYRRQIEKAEIISMQSESEQTKRIVNNYHVKKDDVNGYEMFYLEIKADSFLWHQIRCIMAILLLVGTEREQPDVILELLDVEKNPRKPQYAHAIAVPLNLYHCEMRHKSQHFRSEQENKPEKDLNCCCAQGPAISEWYFKDSNLCNLISNLQGQWTRLNIQVTMIGSVLNDLETLLHQYFPLSKVQSQSSTLEAGAKCSQYRKLMNRERCESLENRIQYFAKKQRFSAVNQSDLIFCNNVTKKT